MEISYDMIIKYLVYNNNSFSNNKGTLTFSNMFPDKFKCLSIKGNQLNFIITFNVDWNEQTLNGTIKDEVHRMRVFKGFKFI